MSTTRTRKEGTEAGGAGMFKLKDNALRWMACKNPPWNSQLLAKTLRYDASYVSEVFGGRKSPSWRFLKGLAELTGLHDGGELIHYDPKGPAPKGPRGRPPGAVQKEVKSDERKNDDGRSPRHAVRRRLGVGRGKRRAGHAAGTGDSGRILRPMKGAPRTA